MAYEGDFLSLSIPFPFCGNWLLDKSVCVNKAEGKGKEMKRGNRPLSHLTVTNHME